MAPTPHIGAATPPTARITRGKTARNRLRGSDHFLLHHDPGLLLRRHGAWADALCVDLGYGAEPHTTLEWARRLRRHAPQLQILGVEIDPERVARARPFADARTTFREGGFDLPLRPHERVRLVRAFNVLRQYDEHEVAPIWSQLAAQLLPGGLLVDGTSCPYGRTWNACLVRRPDDVVDDAWHLEALVLGANLRTGFDPDTAQTRLPKRYIHRMRPGEAVHGFFTAWKRAVRDTRGLAIWGERQWFAGAARALAAAGHDVVLRPRWLKQGWLVWRFPEGRPGPVPARCDRSAS